MSGSSARTREQCVRMLNAMCQPPHLPFVLAHSRCHTMNCIYYDIGAERPANFRDWHRVQYKIVRKSAYINVQTCCNHDVSEACCSVSNGLPMCQLHIIHMKITGLVLQESFNYSYLSFRYLGVCTPTMCVPYDPKSCACVHLDYEKQQYCKTG